MLHLHDIAINSIFLWGDVEFINNYKFINWAPVKIHHYKIYFYQAFIDFYQALFSGKQSNAIT